MEKEGIAMKRKKISRLLWTLIILLSLSVSVGWAHQARGEQASFPPGEFVPGEVLIKFQANVVPTVVKGSVRTGVESLDAVFREYGVTFAAPLFPHIGHSSQGLERIYKLTLPPTADVHSVIRALIPDTHVEYAEPNYVFHILGHPEHSSWRQSGSLRTPTDPYFTYQWGLNNTGQNGGKGDADIDAPEAWGITTGTNKVMIAVIDTGVDYLHEDLDDGRVRTDIDKDYVNDDNNAIDDNGHGTHVSGIIAAETNNDTGVAGVMWQAQILPLKVCDSKGSCASDDVSSAIRYAADQGARVINMSLGSGHCSETMAEAVNYAYFDKGVTIVAAAGNNGGSIGYPARFAPVVAVGATDDSDHRASFSSFGDDLDVMAPGVDILSTVPHNGYDFLSGTSMASPHVAGVVGLLLSQRPQLTNSQIREILHESADDLGDKGRDDYYGYGRVNAYKALQTATPQNAKDPDKASCPDEVCGATAALSEEPNGKNILADLKAVRDKVFTQDPGRRWARIYYKHQFEVAWLLATHGDLRANAKAGFRAFDPVFHALLDDSRTNGPVILTPELIQAARLALMGVAENGSPALHDDIVREWNRVDPERFVGQDVRDVWKQLCAEERRGWVYLPVVTK